MENNRLQLKTDIDVNDKKIPVETRIQAKKDSMEKALNPFVNFDPDNFEPLATEEEKEVCYRKREIPPEKLPTFGIKPKEILIGQMIGMYESKQDIYLIFAHKCNELEDKIKRLEKIIKNNKLK